VRCSRPNRAGRARRFAPIGAVTALAILLLAACSSSGGSSDTSSGASTGSSSGTAAGQPDLSFFKGQTITYVVANAPGSVGGLQAVAMQSGLEKYLGATVHIEYVPGDNTIGEDKVGTAAPNGLTIGELSLPVALNNIYANTGALTFNVFNASYVGATYTSPFIVVACPGSGITSFSQVVHSTKQISLLDIATGPDNELEHILMAAYNVKHKYITGYTSATYGEGCLRGDGDIMVTTPTEVLNASSTALDPGVKLLLETDLTPSSSSLTFLNGGPTLAQFAKQDPPTTAEGQQALSLALSTYVDADPQFATFGPAGIPANRLLALTDAMRAVTGQALVQAAFVKAALVPGFVAPAAISTYLSDSTKYKSLIEQILGT